MEYNEIKKLDMKSKNIINDNIYKIGNLFPNVIKEGKIDFDELKQELSNDLIDNSKEKYQLTWPGKNEAIIKVNSQIYKTLRPIKKDSINFNKTKNIYIEGDNFEALKILQESYLNKIKCIYIDPLIILEMILFITINSINLQAKSYLNQDKLIQKEIE